VSAGAVMPEYGEGLLVANNNFTHNVGGVNLYRWSGADVHNNQFIDNDLSIGAFENSWNNNFTGNNISSTEGHGTGILLNTSGNADIGGNSFFGLDTGIELQHSMGNLIHNNYFDTFSHTQSSGIKITDVGADYSNTIIGNNFYNIHRSGHSLAAIDLDGANNTRIENNTFDSETDVNVKIYNSNGTYITGNLMYAHAGFLFNNTDNTTIFNNVINYSENDAVLYRAVTGTRWNITPEAGTNIVGGPNLGGNYWAKPDNTGWSQVNLDTDGDGFTDSPYQVDVSSNIDYHPLVPLSAIPTPPAPLPKPPAPGGGSVPVILTPPAGLTWGGSMASETFPDQVCAGSSVPVSITVEAGGNSGWFPGTYGLGTYNDAAGSAGSEFIPVSGVDMVNPGSQYTFSFTITAPSTPGTYTFQYCMRKSDGTWFGDVISITLTVVDCSGSKGAVKDLKSGSKTAYTTSPLSTVIPQPTITPWRKLPV